MKYRIVGPHPVLGQKPGAVVDLKHMTKAQVTVLVVGGHVVKETAKAAAPVTETETKEKERA